MPIKACVFDAYGTLFDVAAAAREAASAPGGERLAECWPQLAEIWRLKQLEYSWLRAVADDYKPFWEVTQDGLDYAMASLKIDDPAMRETLLGLYQKLSAYPEVPAMLSALKKNGYQTAILSNGSDDMLTAAVVSAGISDVLDACLSVEAVGVFKPHRKVYDLVGARMDVQPAEVAFFSSNCWDATHASAYGFQTIWVNRAGNPLDKVGAAPAHTVNDLTAAAALVSEM
jgi:2-haloacid dehalogenase